MALRNIKNFFLENIGLKALALVLAIVLWLIAKGHIIALK